MRVLLSGAAGFIGSSVAQRLLDREDEVVGLDNFDRFYHRSLKERNLSELRSHERFRLIEGDICDPGTLKEALAGVDRVVHLAALAGVRPSLAEPARYMRVNVEGTVRLLEACRKAGVDRLVIASSSSVYGKRSRAPFSERDACNDPASPYAASKRAMELVCGNYHQLYRLGISCLRYFTVYGPRQRPEMAIHKFVRRAVEGKPIPMFGDGSSGRDYTYIDDVVDGTVAALDRQDGRFSIYNLGGAHPVLLKELIEAIGTALGQQLAIEQQPWQAGDVPLTSADVSLAARELGYAPQVPLDEGLRRFVAWYREQTVG